MKSFQTGLVMILVVLVCGLFTSACRGDGDYDGSGGTGGGGGGGGGTSAEAACRHYCACSFANMIPNCQSICESGIYMASDPDLCAECTDDASCGELENNACEDDCY